jgi:hypothetical protein
MGNTGDGSGWHDILQYSFLQVFANDELIDAAELAMLQKLALSDGVVDTQERMVLAQVFARVEGTDLDPAVRAEIERFRAEHGID